MVIRVNIPKRAEETLRRIWGDRLSEAAFDALVIEAYRADSISAAEVGSLLGIEDRWEIEKWLADRRVPLNYTLEDLESDRKTLDRILGKTA